MIYKPASAQLSLDFEEHPQQLLLKASSGLPWIEVAKHATYFVTEDSEDRTSIGQNNAITWPDMQGAFRRKDLESVEAYLQMLAEHGVTCLLFLVAAIKNRLFYGCCLC